MEPVHILTENGQSPPRNGQKYDNDEDSQKSDDVVSLVTAINQKYCSEQCNALPVGSAIFMKANDHLPGKRRGEIFFEHFYGFQLKKFPFQHRAAWSF